MYYQVSHQMWNFCVYRSFKVGETPNIYDGLKSREENERNNINTERKNLVIPFTL